MAKATAVKAAPENGADTEEKMGDKSALFFAHPKRLVAVTDKGDKLYDRRIEEPPDEQFIETVRLFGVLESILVRNDGKFDDGERRWGILDGRKRWAAAVIVTEENEKKGMPPCLVPCTQKRSGDHDAYAAMIIANEHRYTDPLLVRAEKAAVFMDRFGASEDKTALFFHTSKRTVQTWLRVWSLSDEVKAKIKELDIPAANVERLADYPRGEQIKMLDQLITAGNTSRAQVNAALRLSGVTTPSVSEEGEDERSDGEKAQDEAKRRHENRKRKGRGGTKLVAHQIAKVSVKRVRSLLAAIREDPSLNVPQEYLTALGWVTGEVTDKAFAKKLGVKELPA